MNDDSDLRESVAGLAVQITVCRALLVAIIAVLARRDVELERSIPGALPKPTPPDATPLSPYAEAVSIALAELV